MNSGPAGANGATADMPEVGRSDDCGLYVHLPWCARKCPYCDFNSFERSGELPEQQYIDALLRDLQFEAASTDIARFSSIYIGGGTPSLFAAQSIARLLADIRAIVPVTADAEITLEANPGTLESRRFEGYRAAGVNRVSIGVQSLRDEQLVKLGRVHGESEARQAVLAALAAGFDSVNLDLMYGLPGDGVAAGLADLEAALSLGTPHLSWYQLTLEPNTAWERRPPSALPDEVAVEELESRGRALLSAAGYERYEVSAYARPGHRCAHNLRYWRFGDYVGIGAGAHGKRREPRIGGHRRTSKLRNPRSYMIAAGTPQCIESSDTVSAPRAVAVEYLMNALRLSEGTSVEAFAAATGVEPDSIAGPLGEARRAGLLVADANRLCATAAGMARINHVLRMLC